MRGPALAKRRFRAVALALGILLFRYGPKTTASAVLKLLYPRSLAS